jgi:hypothetical protein
MNSKFTIVGFYVLGDKILLKLTYSIQKILNICATSKNNLKNNYTLN